MKTKMTVKGRVVSQSSFFRYMSTMNLDRHRWESNFAERDLMETWVPSLRTPCNHIQQHRHAQFLLSSLLYCKISRPSRIIFWGWRSLGSSIKKSIRTTNPSQLFIFNMIKSAKLVEINGNHCQKLKKFLCS
ncbi:hypothetical protein F0562_012585 [Nyssa sinensis]|uniref:Uncharacterized protein n=1 Tax=Nyssa sinensis TaxID=561372 RepID=A0A5J4ZYH0_9ASTE|nr:hypothetical protein F0562_012585 [Nyssa sinensis]